MIVEMGWPVPPGKWAVEGWVAGRRTFTAAARPPHAVYLDVQAATFRGPQGREFRCERARIGWRADRETYEIGCGEASPEAAPGVSVWGIQCWAPERDFETDALTVWRRVPWEGAELPPPALAAAGQPVPWDSLAELPGARALGVYPGSGAARAGLLPGDRIVAVNGKAVLHAGDLRSLAAASFPGQALTLEYIRGEDGVRRRAGFTVTQADADRAARRPPRAAPPRPQEHEGKVVVDGALQLKLRSPNQHGLRFSAAGEFTRKVVPLPPDPLGLDRRPPGEAIQYRAPGGGTLEIGGLRVSHQGEVMLVQTGAFWTVLARPSGKTPSPAEKRAAPGGL